MPTCKLFLCVDSQTFVSDLCFYNTVSRGRLCLVRRLPLLAQSGEPSAFRHLGLRTRSPAVQTVISFRCPGRGGAGRGPSALEISARWGYDRRGVAAKELGGCMEALAPLFGVKLVSDNPAHSAVPSDKTSRKFQVSSMACSCTASQLHHLTAALPQLHCLTPPMPDGLQLHTRNG